MLRGPLAAPGFRGHFSGHETFPLRHLWLRKAYDAVAGVKPASRNLFTDPEAIITFGVGKNMVTSIRHWALACSIIEEAGEIYRPTALGKFLFDLDSGRDPFMESPATIWLMQWLIAGSAERSTTWFYAFNHLTVLAFDREAVARPIREFCAGRGWRTSAATIKRDVESGRGKRDAQGCREFAAVDQRLQQSPRAAGLSVSAPAPRSRARALWSYFPPREKAKNLFWPPTNPTRP